MKSEYTFTFEKHMYELNTTSCVHTGFGDGTQGLVCAGQASTLPLSHTQVFCC